MMKRMVYTIVCMGSNVSKLVFNVFNDCQYTSSISFLFLIGISFAGKYLQMMAAFYTFKEDSEGIISSYEMFNKTFHDLNTVYREVYSVQCTVQCTVYCVQGGDQPGPGHRGQCPGVLQRAGAEDAGRG